MFSRVDFSSETKEISNGLLIRVQGEIDLATVHRFRTCLEKAISRNRHIVVDLSDLSFLDLKGIGALEEAHRASHAQKHHLVVVGSHPMVDRVIQITELAKTIPVFHSREEALKLIQGLEVEGH